MSKSRIVLEYDNDFVLFGISCHQKEYRLAWAINNTLESCFIRVQEYKLSGAKVKDIFSYYTWDENQDHYVMHLLANRGEQSFLIPEMKQADFILGISGAYDLLDLNEILKKIREIDFVLTAFEIDVEKYKSAQKLILE